MATKKFNLKIAFTSLMYLLIPIIYTLATKKYLVIKTSYDYTYLALMLVTTIVYIIIVSIMVGYQDVGTSSQVPGNIVKKTRTTKKKTATKKKTTTKKK
jgi:hypothetical protein